MVGEVSPELDFAAAARRFGVADRVVVTGFIDYDDFQAAIAACDLCINLRYPTAGETSASLLRVLACGRPAVVSDYAQFAELPAVVAAQVPLVEAGDGDGAAEAADLAAVAADLLARPERRREMGEAAREHVRRRHDPAAAAAAVIAACRELREAASRSAGRRRRPRRRASSPRSSIAGEIRVAGAERPWPEGERRTLRITIANHGPARWPAAHRGAGGVALEAQLHSRGEATSSPAAPGSPCRSTSRRARRRRWSWRCAGRPVRPGCGSSRGWPGRRAFPSSSGLAWEGEM